MKTLIPDDILLADDVYRMDEMVSEFLTDDLTLISDAPQPIVVMYKEVKQAIAEHASYIVY